jgi:hypothetical protein
MSGCCSRIFSLVRRGLSQPLCWRTRKLRALLWPLFAWWSRARPATVVARTKVERAALAYARLFGLGSNSHCDGEHDR